MKVSYWGNQQTFAKPGLFQKIPLLGGDKGVGKKAHSRKSHCPINFLMFIIASLQAQRTF